MPISAPINAIIASSSSTSTGRDTSWITSNASANARFNAWMSTTGWMLFFSTYGNACARISPAKMITSVVPSPTSSSWVRSNSIISLAAGCATSISRKIACPSLVSTIPPMGSSNILSIALGPRHVRTMSATAFAAVMFDTCAWRPDCRSVDAFM